VASNSPRAPAKEDHGIIGGDERVNIDETLLGFEEYGLPSSLPPFLLLTRTPPDSAENSPDQPADPHAQTPHLASRMIPTSRRASGQIDDVEEGPEQANVHDFDLEEYPQRSNQEAYNSGIISKKIG